MLSSRRLVRTAAEDDFGHNELVDIFTNFPPPKREMEHEY